MILIDNFGEDKYCVFYNVTFIDICLRIKVGYAMSFDIPVLYDILKARHWWFLLVFYMPKTSHVINTYNKNKGAIES